MAFNWMNFLPNAGPDPAVAAQELMNADREEQRLHDAQMAQDQANAAAQLQDRRDHQAGLGRLFTAQSNTASRQHSSRESSKNRAASASAREQARRDRAAEIGQARADKERQRQQEVQIVYDKMAAEERERAELIKLKKAQMPGKKRIDVMKAKGMAPQHWGSVFRYVANSDPDYYDHEHERNL